MTIKEIARAAAENSPHMGLHSIADAVAVALVEELRKRGSEFVFASEFYDLFAAEFDQPLSEASGWIRSEAQSKKLPSRAIPSQGNHRRIPPPPHGTRRS